MLRRTLLAGIKMKIFKRQKEKGKFLGTSASFLHTAICPRCRYCEATFKDPRCLETEMLNYGRIPFAGSDYHMRVRCGRCGYEWITVVDFENGKLKEGEVKI